MVFKIFLKIFIKENTERWKEGTRRRVVSLRFHSFIELFQTLCTDDKTVSRALQSTPTWKTIVRLIWRNVWLGHPVHIQGFVNRTVTHRQRRQRTQLLTIVRLFARYSSGQIDRSSKPLSEGYHLFSPLFFFSFPESVGDKMARLTNGLVIRGPIQIDGPGLTGPGVLWSTVRSIGYLLRPPLRPLWPVFHEEPRFNRKSRVDDAVETRGNLGCVYPLKGTTPTRE